MPLTRCVQSTRGVTGGALVVSRYLAQRHARAEPRNAAAFDCRYKLRGVEAQTTAQAHMQARYAILRVLLEAGQGLVSLSTQKVELDRSKILSVGRPAIGAFLQKLNVYKVAQPGASGGMHSWLVWFPK